ncbi:MAG: flagellar motor protein MotB [Caldimonas sp.]|uniref:flagellar motor protein MotB n=1 Tax=Caldimonas sp. TaxID=2838790 RepID=UPI003919F4F1
MAGDSKKLQPIIIKKVKKGGHGHHGGAWKIAYADFVTAMMAFFLLMWLLGSTTEGDRKGIADYFTSPLKIALLSGGSGAGDASHVIKGGGTDLTRTTGQVRQGDIEAERKTINLQALKEQLARAEAASLERLKQRIEQSVTNNPLLVQFRSQIRLDITQDGLRIQIVDEQNRPMFDSGSALVKDYMRAILREIGKVLSEVDNKVTLAGHTDAAPYTSGERGYSNWELSADRANASRRELVAGGLREGQVVRVLGLASSSLLDKDNPLNPINRRISIIVMNKDAQERFERGGDVEAGTAPQVQEAVAPASAAQSFSFPAPGR